jgi:hypothetical protein
MAAKKKIDGRTKAGRAARAKALEKALKAKKLGKKPVKAKKQVTYPARKALKKAGRPTLAAHVKIAKKFPVGEAVAVKTREGIVGEVSHYIDDGKKVVIRRGIENVAETQIIVPTVKLRAASAFEIETLNHSLSLLDSFHKFFLEKTSEAVIESINAESAAEQAEAAAAIDPAFNVVETAEQVQSEADLSDEAEALKIVEAVLKASQSDLTTDAA